MMFATEGDLTIVSDTRHQGDLGPHFVTYAIGFAVTANHATSLTARRRCQNRMRDTRPQRRVSTA